MKRVRLILGAGLAGLVLLGSFSTTSFSSGAGNDCKNRCADEYKISKDTCKAIPYKPARKICEDAAKAARNECRVRCR